MAKTKADDGLLNKKKRTHSKEEEESKPTRHTTEDTPVPNQGDISESTPRKKPKREKQKDKSSQQKVNKAPPTPDELYAEYQKYLDAYANNRSSWKFSKPKQNWVVRHLFTVIPESWYDNVIVYVEGLPVGGVRERVVAEARKVVATRKNKESEIEENENEKSEKSKENEKEVYDEMKIEWANRILVALTGEEDDDDESSSSSSSSSDDDDSGSESDSSTSSSTSSSSGSSSGSSSSESESNNGSSTDESSTDNSSNSSSEDTSDSSSDDTDSDSD
ncbi:uncharacterized protein V2V93DRAFT_378495 [Kockiozyma suomiensis]|uniref:uncharacterized protein n=1 Tax=Kockiozyma suomiensis TaxID=1337062 RepID=UPI0033433A19